MSVLPSPLDTLPTTRRQILTALKIAGETTAEIIASELGISAGATRQHLTAMRASRLVDLRESRDGPGRPRHIYFLSPGGEALFPKSNPDFLNGVLDAATEIDPALVGKLLARMGRIRYEAVRANLEILPFEERLATIASLYEMEGFLPLTSRLADAKFRLTLHHCPIMDTVRRFPGICDAEMLCAIESLAAGGEVVEHRLTGDRVCTLEFTRQPPEDS